MAQAKTGDKVEVLYKGSLQDGTVFDQSQDNNTLGFTLGNKEIIPGFEQAVEGMEEGEKTSVTIPSDEAYGQYDPQKKLKFERNRIPENIELKKGMHLQMPDKNGSPILLTVAELEEDTVTLDANHPLAGHDLTFEIELVKIN